MFILSFTHGRERREERAEERRGSERPSVDFNLSKKLPARTLGTCPIVSLVKNSNTKKKRKSVSISSCCIQLRLSPKDSVHPAETESNSVAKSNSFVGTEEYIAPEIILGHGHDFAVDWWCLGVVLYEMFYGTTPFKGSNRKETFHRILMKSPELVGERTPLRNLIAKLLEKDPKQRISLEEIKGHDFFKGVNWDMILLIQRPPIVPKL